jgi:hypothetical protein
MDAISKARHEADVSAKRAATVCEVARMIHDWEEAGDELYTEFAGRVVTYVEGRLLTTSTANFSA